MTKRKRSSKKPSYYNPWHFHTANNNQAAEKIARNLQASGKDVRIKTNRKGTFTVWERN